MTHYAIRRSDGLYFVGCGYGGPGHPVPYFTDDMRQAQVYKTPMGAVKAAKRFGGYAGSVETDEHMKPVTWFGFIVPWRDGWRTVEQDPKDFDPEDWEGNNGPLG